MTTPAHCQLRDKAKFSAELLEAMGDWKTAYISASRCGRASGSGNEASQKGRNRSMKVHSPEWFDQQILAAQKRVSEWPEWMKQVAVPSRPTTDAEPPIELASEHMQIVGACNTIDDLAMAVKQLCHAIKRHQPDSDTAARAMQLLQKHNLIGSPLR